MKYKTKAEQNFFLSIFISLILILTSLQSTTPLATTKFDSFLKLDIVEAVNLHCKLNNEFHCNPYVVIKFEENQSKSQSTQIIECTKNPKWESSFTFHPKQCYGKITIMVYQFLSPNDIVFLGGKNHLYDEQNFEKGETEAGYLGKIEMDIEKLPFGNIDDWFMLEAPLNNKRVMFPSCMHLRIKWVIIMYLTVDFTYMQGTSFF